MKKKFCLTYWIYTPLFILLMIPTVYLFGVVYFSRFQPGSDCSFVPLFVALGIIFSIAAGAVLLNIIFKWLFRKTEKKICLIPCILIDAIVCTANALTGVDLLSSGSPMPMRGVFIALALAAAVCMIVNLAELFKKAE